MPGDGEVEVEGRNYQGHKETLRLMGVFRILNMAMVSGIQIKVKTHRIVQFMQSVLYLNSTLRRLLKTKCKNRFLKQTPDRKCLRTPRLCSVMKAGLGEEGVWERNVVASG